MANYIQLPNGAYFPALEGEDYQTTVRAAYAKYPEAFGGEKNLEEGPKSGFMPALKSGFSNLKGDVAALAGRTGLMGLPEAEKYIAEQEAYQKKTFAPTTAGWTEAPFTKIGELAGGSLPYMAAPLVAGGALAAGAALAPEAALATGIGALTAEGGVGLSALGAGLSTAATAATSAGQFTGSNLSRQMQEGKTLGETNLTAAALASIPQAALDTVSMKMIPGIGKLFEGAGINLSAKAANDLAKEGIKKTAADYLLTTGKTMGIEGLTEAGQQVFERMQAGLSITDPDARKEYFDNFIGGAVLGGILAPAGRYVERGQEQARFDVGARQKQAADRAAAQTAAQQLANEEQAQAAQAEAQLAAQRQTPEYALQAQQEYLAAEQTQAALLAQLKKGTKEAPLLEADKQENAAIAQQLKEHSATLKKTAAEFNATKRFLPVAETPTTTGETPAGETPAGETAPPAVVSPEETIAQLDAHIEALQLQAQGASPQEMIEFGAKHTELKNLGKKIKQVTKAMNAAKELGKIDLAGKHSKTLQELQAQVNAMGNPVIPQTAPVTDVAPAAAVPTTVAPSKPNRYDGSSIRTRTTSEPKPLKPYTGITEQSLMFPETGEAESTVNLGQGKPPEQSRQELITEFQAAKQVRDRLGMQNAIEKIRALDERSKARSAEARGVGAPKGEVTSAALARDILGQKLTATGSQPASRELTNAAKIEVTPQTLRRQVEELPEKLSPENEQLLNRMLGNFNEFTADPERAQLAAGFLQDARTGIQTARSRDIASELDRLDAAKRREAPTLFGEDEAPVIEGPRKPLPVTGYSEEALPSKPSEQQKDAAAWEKKSAELEAKRKALDKEREEHLQKTKAEADKREQTALQSYNDASVLHNALKAEQDAKLDPIYADYVDAMRNPGKNKAAAAKRQADTALAYQTAKANRDAALASAKADMETKKAELKKVRADNRKALADAENTVDTTQKEARAELKNQGLGVEVERNQSKAAQPQRQRKPKTTTSLTERVNADAAKRKEENKRAERLAAIPGESISHEAYRTAVNAVEGAHERLLDLEAKAADESLPKTTRDKARREIKKIKAAQDYLAGSNEGLAEIRAAAEAALAKLDDKIAHQEKLVADNPTKSRKQEVARSKREKKKLESQLGSYKERAERMPLNTPTERAAKEEDARAERFMRLQEALAIEGTTGALPARDIGPTMRKAQAAGNIRTGNAETAGERIINPGLKPKQGGAPKQLTPTQLRKIVKEASELSKQKLMARKPLTAEEISALDYAHQNTLLEAAVTMRQHLERQQQKILDEMEQAKKAVSATARSGEARKKREKVLQGIERDLSVAYENEAKFKTSMGEEPASIAETVVETQTKAEKLVAKKTTAKKTTAKKTTATKPKRSRTQDAISDVYLDDDYSQSRGVEVESPDLTDTQRQHIENNDVRATLRDLADDDSSSPINRAVARKLSLLLDNTDIHTVENLKDENGDSILGQAISTEVQLDAKEGMSQEVLLHEGTHAAVDRVLAMPEDKLTPTQLAAKRELKALFESAKRDPSITSMNAKSSLKEFAAEVLSNRNLQEQLRNKKWTVSDAFRGFVSTILRLVGFTKAETDTMLGASIKSVEALMVPSSKRGLTSERAINAISAKGEGVPRSSAQKDIAALHNGSNSMQQFADQFGPEIKTKDRTPEDAERVGAQQLRDMIFAVEGAADVRIHKQDRDKDVIEGLEKRAQTMRKYIALPTAGSLDYRVRMEDGKPFDKNNPLHFIQATLTDLSSIETAENPRAQAIDSLELADKRLANYGDLLHDLFTSNDFTTIERALIAKAAGKYSVISDDNGRFKLVDIGADNRHNVAVVSAADAAFIVQKLREGLPLKRAFLEGLQDNADRNAKQNLASHKTGWQKFDQDSSERAAQELNAAAAGTPWCTGNGLAYARDHIANGDFYIYYNNGRPEVAVRMQGQDQIGEVRGNSKGQSLTTEQQQLAEDFLRSKKFAGYEQYINEFARKQTLTDLARNPNSVKPEQLMSLDLSSLDDSDIKWLLRFGTLDGNWSGIRRNFLSDSVLKFFKHNLIEAGEKAMDAGYFPTKLGLAPSDYTRLSPLVTTFNGTPRRVERTKVVATNELDLSDVGNPVKADEFPNLTRVQNLTLGDDAVFDKLAYVGKITVVEGANGGSKSITLPARATVGVVQPDLSFINKSVTLTLHGAETVNQVVLSDKSTKTPFTLKAPDAKYIPKDGTFEKDYVHALWDLPDDNRLMVKYKAEDEIFHALADHMPDPIRTEYELDNSGSGELQILGKAINNWVKTQADAIEVNKIINKFWKPEAKENLLPEKFGTIDAPNRIAENPPYGELTEAPEAPSYARAAKYASNDALSELAEEVVATPKSLRERVGSNVALQLEMQIADMRAGVIKALNNAVEDPNTMGSTRLFRQAVFSITAADQHGAVTQMALSSGPPVMHKDAKGYYEVRSSMKNDAGAVFEAVQDIPDSYGNTEAKMALASVYMIAQRAMNKGLKKLDLGALGVTEAKIASAMAAANADPALKAALENARAKYNAYNRGMIEWLASPQVGAITQADAKAYLKDEDYVPYYRVRADGVAELVFGGEKTITIGDIAHQPYLAELKGGESKIMPLDKSIMRNTMLLVTKGMNNMAVKNVAYAMQAAGQGLGPVDKSGKPTNLMPVLPGKGPADASVIRWTQEPDPSKPDDKGERWLRVQTNGTIFGGVPAELITKSLEGAHLTLPAFLKWGGIAGDLLRAGVTRTPIYLARQLFRDPFAATATSGLDYGPLTAIFKANKEFLKITTGKSEAGAKMIEKGLIQSGMFEGDPANMSKIALQLASGKSQGVLDKLFSKADKLALQADAATRALIYENAIKNGLSEVEASHAVRESMNFNKRGLSPTVQYASRMIPFFNAQIQGLSVLFKAATGNMPANDLLKIKRKFYNNAMMLTGFGLAYAMAMDDDDYYKNAKPKDRYSNFFVPLPGVDEPLKLPIPYEFGFFFSAGVALADSIKGEVDTPQQLRAIKDMFIGAIPGASSKGVPQIVKPIAEIYTNKNFFSDTPLESDRLRKLDTEARYNAHTTEVAKWMSKMAPVLSPIQIEHIVSGYLGQIPMMVLASTNDLFRDGKAEPTRKMSDMPLIGSSFQRKYGGEEADVVYKLATDAAEAKRTFDSYRKTGKIEEAKDYMREHRAEIVVAPMALQYQKLMGALRTQEEIIRGSNMPSDAKAKRIDDLDKQRQLQSERYLKAIRRAEEASDRTTRP